MKIAVGIMAIGFSLFVLFQSFIMMGVIGPDHLQITEETVSQGLIYLILAILIFVGAAFSFALPKVAIVVFVLGFLFPKVLVWSTADIQIWGTVSLVFGLLLFVEIAIRKMKRPSTDGHQSNK